MYRSFQVDLPALLPSPTAWAPLWKVEEFKLEYPSCDFLLAVAVLGKNIWGAWPLIIWEATTAKRNYYRTN